MKKLKVGMTVRHDNGQIGEIIDFDDKHPVFNVKVRFQDETQHLWVSRKCLKVHKEPLRLVSNSELTDPLPEEEKPLERGDLVEFCGAIWVVFSKDADGEYMIAPLTGGSNCCYSVINKLPRVGSIRKKVNRLQAQMEGEK